MIDDNASLDYQRLGLSLISAAYYAGGESMTALDLKSLTEGIGEDGKVNWGAVVGVLVGIGEFLLHEVENPDEILQRLGLVLAQKQIELETGVTEDE